MDLKFSVIHSFDKEPKTHVIKGEVRKQVLLDCSQSPVVSLVKTLNTLLGKPGNNVVWGQFANDGREGKFPGATYGFLDNLESGEDFLSLSHLVLDELSGTARKEFFATGGHILVALYEQQAIPYLLVASIKQRDGLTLDKNLVPTDVSEIDLSKIHQAARINLSRLSEVVASQDEDDEDEIDKTYLCFISKGDKEASGYFIVALGCTKGVASAKATRNAIDLVESYFKDNSELKRYRHVAKDNVVRYLQECIKNPKDKQPARLEDICRSAVRAIPPELIRKAEGQQGSLLEYLNNEENKVPDEFAINPGVLRERARIKGKANNWDVNFEKSALGTSVSSEICYDPKAGKLTLSRIPDKLKREIEQELKEREQPVCSKE